MSPGSSQMLERLTMIVQQCPEGICLIDRRHVVEYANLAWAKLHGYSSSAELIGLPLRTFHTDAQMKQDVYPFLQMVERIGRYNQPLGRRRNDRSECTTETTAMLVQDEDDAVVGYVLFIDPPVTEPENEPVCSSCTTPITQTPQSAASGEPSRENHHEPRT